ncbi:MAG TPA: universal stress protein [Mycobacteriales bacterium]|nr:universal stress protein [Mycobacteriales bacterium]
MSSYRTVIVGTDGSESSFRAVERAASVSHDAGASLIIACAFRPLRDRDRQRAESELGELSYQVSGSHPAEDLLREAEGIARKVGAESVTAEAVEGDPVDCLAKLVETKNADLIVVGNRGLNSIAGRILGSVPANISHRAGCDVLIVHTTGGR